jgi:hypothetical protein
VIAAALFLAQLAPAPEEPQPVATTIAAIIANPRKFDGRTVRLHGYVDACQPLSCLIHERASNAPAGAGQTLSIAPDAKFDDVVRPLLPTYVEFDARFSAACRTGSVCTGRAPELTIVSLRGVVSPEPPPFENN